MRRTAALIVGGGPAGSAAAIALGQGGVRAELVERTTGPHDTVCGGFLGWDATAALEKLGIDPHALGARPIGRLRLAAGSRVVEADLPGRAIGLSRRALDEAMLAAAARAGAGVARGATVRSADARTVRLADGGEIAADALFLATGKHELRGAARPLDGWREAPSVGLRASLPPSPALERALAGTIELHLFDGGYAGLLLQEDGSANLCLSASRARLAAAGGPDALAAEIAAEAPLLGERMAAGAPGPWTAIAGVPYGWRARETQAGVFRLGDQSAVVSSLAGDGVAIGLTSGIAAAEAYLRGGPDASHRYQVAFAKASRRPLRIANALRHAAEDRDTRPVLMGLARVPGLARLAARLTRIA